VPEQKNILFKGSSVFYRVYGVQKPVVVLIHGFAETGDVWHHQIKYLQKKISVIVPDLPGYGKSEELTIETEKTTIADYAECVFAILQKENIERCVILGHSMGGYITLAIAEKHPEILSSFGFVHSTAFADSDEKKQARLRGTEMIEKYGGYTFLKNTTPNLFAQKFKDEHAADIEKLVVQGKNFSKKSLQQSYYAMMNRPERKNILKNAKIPVLFIAGKHDNAVSLNDILKQVHLPEISYIHILNNDGHMGMWEAAHIVNERLEGFVNETA
jgi:pimeloyl-ACP methyl ester carboxylesterase